MSCKFPFNKHIFFCLVFVSVHFNLNFSIGIFVFVRLMRPRAANREPWGMHKSMFGVINWVTVSEHCSFDRWPPRIVAFNVTNDDDAPDPVCVCVKSLFRNHIFFLIFVLSHYSLSHLIPQRRDFNTWQSRFDRFIDFRISFHFPLIFAIYSFDLCICVASNICLLSMHNVFGLQLIVILLPHTFGSMCRRRRPKWQSYANCKRWKRCLSLVYESLAHEPYGPFYANVHFHRQRDIVKLKKSRRNRVDIKKSANERLMPNREGKKRFWHTDRAYKWLIHFFPPIASI